MIPSQLWLNFWAFVFACFILVAVLVVSCFVLPGMPPDTRHFWMLIVAVQALAVVLLFIGSVANFSWGILRGWPIYMLVAGFLLTGLLLPFSIRAIVLWRRQQAYWKGERPTP